jgi:uncharacterized protein (TIGR03067 family)
VRPTPITVRVTGDRWVLVADGKETRHSFTLRPDADPKEIDLVLLGPDDKPTALGSRGVYAIERGAIKVVHAPNSEPRPATTDETDPNFTAGVWILERVQ